MPDRNEIFEQIVSVKNNAQDETRRKIFKDLHAFTSRDSILYASSFWSRKSIKIPALFLSIDLGRRPRFHVCPSWVER